MTRLLPLCLALIAGCSTSAAPTTTTTAKQGSSATGRAEAATSEVASADSRAATTRADLPEDKVSPDDTRAAVEAGNAFACDLYARLRQQDQRNLFFSPFSIHIA